jgi:hypothetical protein
MRALALAAAVVLLVMFGTLRTETETIPDGTRDATSIGVWFSPWFTCTRVETHTKDVHSPGFSSSMSSHMQVEFLSWSWVALVGAIVLLRYGCRRPREAPAP